MALSPRLTFIVACFALIVDFLKKVLVVFELSFVHTAHPSSLGLFLHLSAQEILVLLIDISDLGGEPLLFQLVVVLVGLPDASLLIVVGLLSLLTHLLLAHLASQQVAHLLLLLSLTSGASFILEASAHFLLHLVLQKCLLLSLNALLLFRDDFACESVHEILGARLPSSELTESVVLLLVQHLAVLVLRLDISANLGFALLIGRLFISLVLAQHLLEVLFLLATLLLLEGTLHLHLLLKTIDKVDLSLELFLVLLPLTELLLLELAVAALLLLHDLLVLRLHLLLLALTEQLHVLGLESLVHAALLKLVALTLFLLLELLVELLTDQSAALLLTHHGLLLFLVVKERVELLDGRPLVLFGQLRVHLGASCLARGDAQLVGCSARSPRSNALRLGAAARAGYRFVRTSVIVLTSRPLSLRCRPS